MGLTVFEKIIKAHLVEGEMKRGERIAIRMDQTLTQDATGTMAYLEFEAMGVSKVKTELSVSYVDHNMIQGDFRNPDDHRYLQDIAAKYGIVFSRPGNGICHQLHVERFARPGKTLIGSDSHTPTSGGVGMIAIGAGGLDVAMAMAGEPFYLTMPKMVKINLTRRAAALRIRQGRDPRSASPARREGRSRQGSRICRPWPGDPLRLRSGYHHQHGCGDRRHHLPLPQRSCHPGMAPGPGSGVRVG